MYALVCREKNPSGYGFSFYKLATTPPKYNLQVFIPNISILLLSKELFSLRLPDLKWLNTSVKGLMLPLLWRVYVYMYTFTDGQICLAQNIGNNNKKTELNIVYDNSSAYTNGEYL